MNKQTMLDKEGNEVEVEVFFEHYRPLYGIDINLPSWPRKGRPDDVDLYRYAKGKHEDGRRIGFRADDKLDKSDPHYTHVHPTGGKTICSVRLSNSEHAIGVAWCSYSDTFNYRLGRQIAFGRALHKLGLH